MVRGWEEAALRERFADDPWLCNFLLSVWERDQGRAVVTTYPWHQAFVITEHCNARCRFCSYWLNEVSVIERDFFEHLRPVLRFARSLVLTGGEPTLHPDLVPLLEDFTRWTDDRCFRSIITNGLRLPELLDDLLRLSFNVSVSLNAGTPELHHQVMRLGPDALPGILDSIRRLKAEGRYVSVSFVVTAKSLPEVPAYLALCDELGVDLAYLRTPTPIGGGFTLWEDYADLAPSAHPEFASLRDAAVAALATTRVPVDAYPEQWSVPTPIAAGGSTAPRELRDLVRGERTVETGAGQPLPDDARLAELARNDLPDPYGRAAPLTCDHVYFSLESMAREHRLEPCCFMPRVPGHEAIGLTTSDDFLSLWNAPAMVALRTRLAEGPLFPMCKVCTYNRLGY
jgi:pyruvate-formate lyase-activating enzyme